MKRFAPMTGAEYRATLDRLGLDHEQIAAFLGGHRRTSTRWQYEERPVPQPVAILLRYMVRKGLKPSDMI